MLIRILRPCEIAGRIVAAGLPLDLPEATAAALIEAGDAAPWEGAALRAPQPAAEGEAASPPAPRRVSGRTITGLAPDGEE
ncbi:hypothetical protein [Crenalkalicoccus roseus]|uniref:hypothetical protein n=1 Tax=Crenalkalicoccus roseus TaxID=1485588 RepID=UPI001081457F|nr:hypothetical protein [Crenalkalicoccus roseus]